MNLAFVVTTASSPYFFKNLFLHGLFLVLANSKTQIHWTNPLDKQTMFSLVKKKKKRFMDNKDSKTHVNQ